VFTGARNDVAHHRRGLHVALIIINRSVANSIIIIVDHRRMVPINPS
jgi:hypothetical protein